MVDSFNVIDDRNVTVNGHVTVSDLTSCPALRRIDAKWQDCSGNVVATAVDGGADTIAVLDTTPPVVTSNVNLARLWSPNHALTDVGFSRTSTDNCDAGVAATLATGVWSDDSDTMIVGVGNFAPDAKGRDGTLRLRSERAGPGDGRVYLMTSCATDDCGNMSFACSTVGVPANNNEQAAANLQDQQSAALQYCNTNSAPPPAFFQHGLAGEVGSKQ